MLFWEKVLFILGVLLLLLCAKSFSDKTRSYFQYIVGVIALVMVVRHAPEVLGLIKKYADTMWPVTHEAAERFIDSFGRLMHEVTRL